MKEINLGERSLFYTQLYSDINTHSIAGIAYQSTNTQLIVFNNDDRVKLKKPITLSKFVEQLNTNE